MICVMCVSGPGKTNFIARSSDFTSSKAKKGSVQILLTYQHLLIVRAGKKMYASAGSKGEEVTIEPKGTSRLNAAENERPMAPKMHRKSRDICRER